MNTEQVVDSKTTRTNTRVVLEKEYFVPTFVQEGQVLLDHREEGDDGRLHALAAQDVAVLGHVPGWVEHILQVPKQLLVLAGQFFPGTPQTGHRCQV